MAATSELRLHSDRLLPSESGLRSTARQLYESVKDLPIISPHGHVPAHWLADDIAFHDPTSLLITPDHYVNRQLHAHGVELSALGVGQGGLTEETRRAMRSRSCARTGAAGGGGGGRHRRLRRVSHRDGEPGFYPPSSPTSPGGSSTPRRRSAATVPPSQSRPVS
jgi:hypothetical protein